MIFLDLTEENAFKIVKWDFKTLAKDFNCT